MRTETRATAAELLCTYRAEPDAEPVVFTLRGDAAECCNRIAERLGLTVDRAPDADFMAGR